MMKSIEETRRNLLQRIHTEGVEAAFEASLAICQDPSAAAPARATASSTIFRVAGYFERKDAGAMSKEPHEMSAEELAEEIRKLESRRAGGSVDIFE